MKRMRARPLARRAGRPAPRAALGRPTYRPPRSKPLPLAETPVPPATLRRLTTPQNSYVRGYRLGECTVLVTREDGRWHLSIAHPDRLPTWREVAEARYRLMPQEIVAAMVLPPKHAYVNVHEFCFQVYEVRDPNPEFQP